jgi:hypothetical protein
MVALFRQADWAALGLSGTPLRASRVLRGGSWNTIHQTMCVLLTATTTVTYPTHRSVKKRNVVHASRRLNGRYQQWQTGEISFAEFDASVQGWVNHVRYADTWGLRKKYYAISNAKKSDHRKRWLLPKPFPLLGARKPQCASAQ